jgi:hypothetical protein
VQIGADEMAADIADTVKNSQGRRVRVAVVSDSGFFLEEDGFASSSGFSSLPGPFPALMRGIHDMMNSTAALPGNCIRNLTSSSDHYKCMLAQYIVPHLTTPVMLMQVIHRPYASN